MGLTFFELYRRLHEADMPPPPPGGAAPGGAPPPPGPGAPDPLAIGGGTTPPPAPGGDPSMGGAPGAPAGGGKPKIIKITTVWDALENALGGKAQKPKTQVHAPEKKVPANAPKSLHT